MAKRKEIVQIAPASDNPNAPGTYGWGFALNGFRVVMYGPKECDHEVIRSINRGREEDSEPNDSRTHEKYRHQAEASHRKTARRGGHAKGPNFIKRGEEHGPAHVHVIDRKSGRESKFELIEHYLPGVHDVQLIKKNGSKAIPLAQAEIDVALPVLKEYAPDFIQLWREFYQNTKLGNYVTRVSEKYVNCQERITFDSHGGKYVDLEDRNSGKIAQMPFDDYRQLAVHRLARRRR